METTKTKAERVVFVWKCENERESRGIYVFDVSEFEILSEWEYTCTAGIYFMGISSGAQI